MSAVTAIVLADALGSPANHTFTPLGPDSDGIWWFEDQSQSSPIGYWRISLRLKRTPPAGNGQAAVANRVNRVTLAFHMPSLEALGTSDSGLTPPPTISYIDRGSVEFVLPERDTLQNRKDLRKMLKNLIDNTQVVDMVESLQNVY